LIINIMGEKVALGPLVRETVIALEERALNDFATLRSMWELAPVPTTRERIERWYDGVTTREDAAHFLVYERASGDPIGRAGVRDIDFRNRSAEFAITIADTRHRGKGYGTEAARLALDYAFTALGLHNVLLTAVSFNESGLRAYQRAGFREIGRRRECWLMGGRWYDEVYMDCIATEFDSPVLKHIFVPDEVGSG